MSEIDVLRAQMVRPNPSMPWGMRLRGGVHEGLPISIVEVREGSPAHKIGLRPGDHVTEIGDAVTHSLTSQQAAAIANTFGLTLILTIERQATGPARRKPMVVSSKGTRHPPNQASSSDHQHRVQHSKPTSGENVNGSYQSPRRVQECLGEGDDGQTQSRTFKLLQDFVQNDDGSARGVSDSAAADHSALLHAADGARDDPHPHQSRTFRVLQDMVDNPAPPSGVSGLPPPRSTVLEKKRAERAQKPPGSARVKVFMPQQYNSPLGIYSTENVVDTFQHQADVRLEQSEATGQL